MIHIGEDGHQPREINSLAREINSLSTEINNLSREANNLVKKTILLPREITNLLFKD